jgi:succinyl-diaminopimelate desuccinylase
MLIQILKKLITFKTVTRNFYETKRALNWIKNFTKSLPVYHKEIIINGFTSLIITTQNTKRPKLFLQAHIDVVPASEKLFSPKVKNHRLYGRGAWDMKFAIACYLQILKELGKNLKNYDFGIMITSDEEIGGENGVKALLEKGYSCRVCVLPDGGDWGKIDIAAKGVWHLKIESYGKSAPASRPWKGKNAVLNLIRFLDLLKEKFPKEPCKIKNHYHNTINIGQLNGGKVANQVPDFAEALVDIRFIPETKIEDLRKLVRQTKKNFPNIKIQELILAESYKVDYDNNYFKEFVSLYKKYLGQKLRFTFNHGSSDARFFAKKGIPVILTAPKGGGTHSENEFVDLKSLETFYRVLKQFVEKVTKI